MERERDEVRQQLWGQQQRIGDLQQQLATALAARSVVEQHLAVTAQRQLSVAAQAGAEAAQRVQAGAHHQQATLRQQLAGEQQRAAAAEAAVAAAGAERDELRKQLLEVRKR
jgi:hypothetical protein